jgi:DNA-binding NarL/FixJ family response regulator
MPPTRYLRNLVDAALRAAARRSLKILVVDDNAIVRKQICELLTSHPGLEVVCEAANGLEAVRDAEKHQPDIISLDISMPALGGIEAAARIRRVAPKSRIVFLSQHESKNIAQAALATGGLAYVVKSAAATDLIPAVLAAAEGKSFVSKLRSRSYGFEKESA